MTAPRAEMRRYAGKTVQQRDGERRARLLDAGLEVFGTIGYAASTIEAICSRARVATRDFYVLFHNKARLLLAVDERIVTETARQINAALQARGEPGVEETMTVGLRAYANSFAADPRRVRVHFFEVFAIALDALEHRRTTGDQLIEIFHTQADSLMRRGLIPRRDLSITSGALLGATRYAISDWATNRSAHSIEEVINELVRLYISAVR